MGMYESAIIFSQCTWLLILSGRRNCQRCEAIQSHGLWPIAWIDRDLLKTCLENWQQGDQGKGMWIDLPEWTKNVKIFVSPIKAHQRVTSAEETFNNQTDRMTSSVGTGQPPFTDTPVIAQWAHEHSGHGGRDGGYARIRNLQSHCVYGH